MADGTHIEWTDATWNPITGCSVVSPGCTNCYAMRLAGTRLADHPSRAGLTRDSRAGPVWTGEVRFNEQWLTEPLRWRRPRRVFVCAHGDLFHPAVPVEWIDRVFAVMALARQHTFQVLTKRPERMRDYIRRKMADAPEWVGIPEIGARVLLPYEGGWPTYVWLGVSVEDQARAEERIPLLLDTPAAVRWISAEPLLGPVDASRWLAAAEPDTDMGLSNPRLDWVVAGGESGPGARPTHPDWARSLRDQCQAAGVPFLFKQWGVWSPVYDRDVEDPDWRRCDVIKRETPRGRWMNIAGGHGFHGERVMWVVPVGKKAAGRFLDGRLWDEYPTDTRGRA